MRTERNQTTLIGPCTVSGRGYWSGEQNTLTFLPAPAGTGIRFVRADLVGHPGVSAVAEHRVSMPLRTRLSSGRCEVDMIEHVMAALYGLGIDNCEVHCSAAEMPGMDGSSLAFTLALDSVGRTDLRAKRSQLVITQEIRIGNEQQWILAQPPAGAAESGLTIEYRLDYGQNSPIEAATFTAQLTDDLFYHEMAPARTFISESDARTLQAQGLATHVTERDLIVFGKHGPMNNELRFSDECARHKALDLVGDLALAGIDLVGRITAYRSGHQLNGQMAAALREAHLANFATKAA